MSSWPAYYRQWTALSFHEKKTFLRAAFLLLIIGAGLKVLPFSVFKRTFYRLSSPSDFRKMPPAQIETMAWAVRSAAHHLPFRLLCLPQALALKYFLRNESDIALHIGVQKDPEHGFQAHAWVEKDSRVIIGDLPGMMFQSLWVWQ